MTAPAARVWLAVALAILTIASLRLQGAGVPQTVQATGTALILGRVVDADSGNGVPSIVVTLASVAGVDATAGSQVSRMMLTDLEGRFVFRALPAGSYRLTTSTGGTGFSPSGFLIAGSGHRIAPYLNGAYGQRRPGGPAQTIELTENGRLIDAVIRLWKGGAIDGSVYDEAGEPLVNVAVAAVRVSSEGRLLTGPSTVTDDRGAYHLGTLPPGRYFIVVPLSQTLMPLSTIDALLSGPPNPAVSGRLSSAGAPSIFTTGVQAGGMAVSTAGTGMLNITNRLPPRAEGDRLYAYRTTFHPSAPTPAGASAIPIRPGEERQGIDVHLQPVPVMPVSGVLVDATGPVPDFGVHLLPAETGEGVSVLTVASTATDANGSFMFPLVPSGSYRVIALRTGPIAAAGPGAPPPAPTRMSETSGAWVDQSIAVGDQPVTGVVATLRPGTAVRGRLDFREGGARPAPDRLSRVQVLAVRTPPLFRNDGVVPRPRGRVAPSGDFVIDGLPPGRYALELTSLPGWSVQGIELAGRDIADAPIAVGTEALTEVVVALTASAAQVSGSVRTAANDVAPEASVLLFSADRARWADARVSTRSFQTVRVSADGTFTVPDVPPGEYLVTAIADPAASDWPDVAWLAKLAPQATSIRVLAGQSVKVGLRVAVLR